MIEAAESSANGQKVRKLVMKQGNYQGRRNLAMARRNRLLKDTPKTGDKIVILVATTIESEWEVPQYPGARTGEFGAHYRNSCHSAI